MVLMGCSLLQAVFGRSYRLAAEEMSDVRGELCQGGHPGHVLEVMLVKGRAMPCRVYDCACSYAGRCSVLPVHPLSRS